MSELKLGKWYTYRRESSRDWDILPLWKNEDSVLSLDVGGGLNLHRRVRVNTDELLWFKQQLVNSKLTLNKRPPSLGELALDDKDKADIFNAIFRK